LVEITPVESPDTLEHFLRFPWKIYEHDPYWVPPYVSQIKKRLDSNRNPFFQYASRKLFVGYSDGQVVGTIAAIVNDLHNRQLNEKTGFFGFFESINDDVVAESLVNAAASWLRQRGMNSMRGPINGAPTDEVGVLIDGHKTRPSMWEGHSPPYYQTLLENLGFQKYDDVFAYEITYQHINYNLNNLPGKLFRAAAHARADPKLVIRKTNRRYFDRDVIKVHDLYNTTFRTIPGHIDMSLDKFQSSVDSVRPFLDLDLILIAEYNDQPIGFAVVMPDINEVLQHFNGYISPLSIVKFQFYLKRIRTACFKLLGVLPEYRGRGIEALFAIELAKQLVSKKYKRLEISLAAEKNIPMNRIIRRMGGKVYRWYRIYERQL
jgi:GNAT superfamily N-acetyltransferase